jgi:hypothetical protein
MAKAFVLDFEGGTLDQYDAVIEKMGFERQGAGAEGALFHWVTKTDSGIRVTDVWHTQEAFDAFAEAKIGPLTAEQGLAPPRVQSHEVHNWLTAPGA